MTHTDFIFDGIDSKDMGLSIVQIGSGFYETPFIGGQEVDEVQIGHKNYFFGTKKKCLEFELTFSLLDEEFTSQRRFEIAKWLVSDEYKPFKTYDDLSKTYNIISTGASDLMTGGGNKGYFTMKFKTDAPWAWSDEEESVFDLSAITVPTKISVENKSNVLKYYEPEMEFTLVGSTGVSFKNASNGGETLGFTGLQNGETVYVDNDKGDIVSNTGLYRLSNCNRKWLRLVQGLNEIEVTGKCIVAFRCKFPLYK